MGAHDEKVCAGRSTPGRNLGKRLAFGNMIVRRNLRFGLDPVGLFLEPAPRRLAELLVIELQRARSWFHASEAKGCGIT
jgi:hypothetical protein